MKQTKLYILLIFAIILNACSQSSTEANSNDENDWIHIPGTRVSFPQSSFTSSKGLVGLANENDAIILVTEFLNQSFEDQAENAGESFIQGTGGIILDSKNYRLAGYNARQLIIESPDSTKVRIVLFGDNEFCTYISAKHFLDDTASEKEIIYLLDNVKYDKSITIDPFEFSPFFIDGDYDGFKHFNKSQRTHFFTRNGTNRTNGDKDPSLAIFYGSLNALSEFEQTFKSFASLNDVSAYKKQINGYNAYEGVFDLEDGNKRYYLFLEKDMQYIVVRGTAMENYDSTLADFMKFAHQIKFKE